MKLFSWNINGIRAVIKKGELQNFFQKYQPDIVCFQETKAEQSQFDFNLDGYNQFFNSAKTKKGYSGTAIFSKIPPLNVTYDIPLDIVDGIGLLADGYGHANDEGRIIAAEFDDFYVVTAYTPNAKEDLTRLALREKWDEAVIAYCSELQLHKPVLYCGDMNVAHTEDDLANPKANMGKKGFTAEERSGFDAWLEAGFVDVFRRNHEGNGYYTWWSHFAKARERNVGWRIDYWLASKVIADRVKNPQIHPAQMGSDHCPVSIEF